jgi:uncharacterized protein YggU (UPF0235/DUF167 family)
MDVIDLTIRLTPRAARETVDPRPDGVLAVRVTAPPIDGRANDALCRLIARRAGVPPSRVSVVRGHRGRDKVVRIDGADPALVHARLGLSRP